MSNIRHDYAVSFIRVLAMILIVFYHCLAYNNGAWTASFGNTPTYGPVMRAINSNIVTIALDAFVLIAGLLYYRIAATGKYDDTKRFLCGKIKRLLVPYLIWGLLLCVIFPNVEHIEKLADGISHLWFLLMLFDIFVIVTLTKKCWMNLGGVICSIVLFIILLPLGAVMYKLHLLPPILDLASALSYLPMFYLGMLTEKYRLYDKMPTRGMVSLAVLCQLFAIGVMLSLMDLPIMFMYAWLPTFLFILVAYKMLRVITLNCSMMTGARIKALGFLDRYSMSIYIIHHILIWAFLIYYPNAQGLLEYYDVTLPLLLFAIAFTLSLAMSYLIGMIPGAEYITGIRTSAKRI